MLDRAKYQFIGLDEGQRQKARNPDWTRDEIMLALEFYLDHRNKIPGKESAEIATLSEEIKRVASALGLSGDEKFRNANGVYMKIMNIRSHDPAYTSQGKVGLASASKLEEEVWSRFGEDLPTLKTLNASIRAQSAGSQIDPLYAEYDEPEVAEAAQESSWSARSHHFKRPMEVFTAKLVTLIFPNSMGRAVRALLNAITLNLFTR
jgi:5-methylcytosine-specific restriction protein A